MCVIRKYFLKLFAYVFIDASSSIASMMMIQRYEKLHYLVALSTPEPTSNKQIYKDRRDLLSTYTIIIIITSDRRGGWWEHDMGNMSFLALQHAKVDYD